MDDDPPVASSARRFRHPPACGKFQTENSMINSPLGQESDPALAGNSRSMIEAAPWETAVISRKGLGIAGSHWAFLRGRGYAAPLRRPGLLWPAPRPAPAISAPSCCSAPGCCIETAHPGRENRYTPPAGRGKYTGCPPK